MGSSHGQYVAEEGLKEVVAVKGTGWVLGMESQG